MMGAALAGMPASLEQGAASSAPMGGMTGAALAGIPILVTGSTGFVGRVLTRRLCESGAKVRALVRPTSDWSPLADLNERVERAVGDLADLASLAAAARGMRIVVHAGAHVGDWGPASAFMSTNYDGTRAMLAASAAAGVERFVQVSSLTVLGLGRAGQTMDEESPLAMSPPDAYTRSKIAAELAVREAHGQGGMETVVVRPGVIWGAGDPTIIPRFVALLRRGRLPYIAGGKNRVALTHVENLVHGLMLASVAPGAGGELFHVLDEERLTARETLDALAEAVGLEPPRFSLPFGPLYAIAALCEWTAQLLRSRTPPPLSRYGVRLVASDGEYDAAKAARVLGYVARLSFREGMAGLGALEARVGKVAAGTAEAA